MNLVKQKQFASSKPYRNIKYPCGVCAKRVNRNQKAIYCDSLKQYHRKCNGISLEEYEALVDEPDDLPWLCITCTIDEMASKFPFGYLSIIELSELYGIDLPSQLELPT